RFDYPSFDHQTGKAVADVLRSQTWRLHQCSLQTVRRAVPGGARSLLPETSSRPGGDGLPTVWRGERTGELTPGRIRQKAVLPADYCRTGWARHLFAEPEGA